MKREGEGSLSAVAYVDGQPLTRTAGSGTGGGTSRSAAPSAEPTAHSCRPARLHPHMHAANAAIPWSFTPHEFSPDSPGAMVRQV